MTYVCSDSSDEWKYVNVLDAALCTEFLQTCNADYEPKRSKDLNHPWTPPALKGIWKVVCGGSRSRLQYMRCTRGKVISVLWTPDTEHECFSGQRCTVDMYSRAPIFNFFSLLLTYIRRLLFYKYVQESLNARIEFWKRP